VASALDLDGTPIVRAMQVHGNRAVSVRETPPAGSVRDAGECDVLATDVSGLALVVQTADCVPILLTASGAIATAHAGWRGTAVGVANSAVEALARLGAKALTLRAWLGPSIGPCCYEVGGEVAAQFAGEFLRASCGGRFRLDLAAVNRAQLEAAGVPAENISAHPACTRCGGEQYASYRRDGAAAGRMIGLVVRR
jgi:YfiH family protein